MNAKYEIVTTDGIQLSGLNNINEKLTTHYLIYRIDNIENNTFYIGLHKTKNPYDKYMGSGVLILALMKAYLLSSYIKTILFDFDNEDELNTKEFELVPEISCHHNNPLCLNIVEGGRSLRLSGERNGMFGKNPYANLTPEELSSIMFERTKRNKAKPLEVLDNENKKRSITCKNLWKDPEYVKKVHDGLEKSKTPEYLKKLSDANSGENNPMYGHSVTEFMSEDKINLWHLNLKAAQQRNKDRKWMYSPEGKNKYVKPEQWQEFLANGWKFGRNVKNNKIKKTNSKDV